MQRVLAAGEGLRSACGFDCGAGGRSACSAAPFLAARWAASPRWPSVVSVRAPLPAGVPARLQQLLPHPILGPEARNVITNLSGAAPHVFLNLASSGSNKAARGPTSGGAGGSGAAGGSAGAADAAVRAQLSALDVGAPCFNVEDAVFAMTTCSNLLTAAPTTYAKGACPRGRLAAADKMRAVALERWRLHAGSGTHKLLSPLPLSPAAMVSAGVPEAMLAACDRIVDAPALEEFRALSDNAAAMSNVAQVRGTTLPGAAREAGASCRAFAPCRECKHATTPTDLHALSDGVHAARRALDGATAGGHQAGKRRPLQQRAACLGGLHRGRPPA